MVALEIVLAALGVWRLTHLLNAESGPWDLLARARGALGRNVLGAMLDCFYCLSLWLALPVACGLALDWRQRLLAWPALSALAILLERTTQPRRHAPAPWVEQG